MSGEVWATPVVVPVGSTAPTTYFENVRQNIAVLGKGGGRVTPEVATAAPTLTLPNNDDNIFTLSVTGSVYIAYMSVGDRPYGNSVDLIVSGAGAVLLNNTGSVPSGCATILPYVSASGWQEITLNDKLIVTLKLTPNGWVCTI